MTSEDQRIMSEYGITCETKMVFYFQGHRYERLSDAANYATKQRLAPQPAKRQDLI